MTAALILQYAGLRARTLHLDPALWGLFGNLAVTYFESGHSAESALQMAAKRLGEIA